MNFLAHAFLSENHEKIMVGNFIADFVKGKSALAAFKEEIKTGIELHRAIDFYTDSHPVVAQSKARLKPKYRHYAGVIVDVFYDYYLAKEWTKFSSEPLTEFAKNTYAVLLDHRDVIPVELDQMLPYMIRGNWLVNYGTMEGIGRALSGMSQRTPYVSKMDEAVVDLSNYREEFGAEFNAFFPDLHDHAKKFLEMHHRRGN
jgi:acyl carrier protein phosphodiesterase